MSKSVVVIDDFISKEKAMEFEKFLSNIAIDSEHAKHYRVALGYENSVVASKIGYSEPVLRGYEGNEQLIEELGGVLVSIKETVEAHFMQEMDTVQFAYHQMTAGARNALHSDSTKLDGSPYNDDGTPEELEWSALLYLTSHGEDFTGGEIVFPKQDLVHKAVKGQLLFFKGDHHHPHGVETVTSGERSVLVAFFGKRGNVSESAHFAN